MRPASHRSPRSSQAGFSMIELLTVIGIIAILAVVAIPSVAGFLRTYKFRGAVSQVSSEIAAARGRAISRNTNFGVVFLVLPPNTPGNPTGDVGYRWVYEDPVNGVFPDGTSARKSTAELLNLADQLGPLRTLPPGIQFANPTLGVNNDRGIRFDRLGSMCDPGGGATPAAEPCPALDAGTNYLFFQGAEARVSVVQTQTGLRSEITVERGGRIRTP